MTHPIPEDLGAHGLGAQVLDTARDLAANAMRIQAQLGAALKTAVPDPGDPPRDVQGAREEVAFHELVSHLISDEAMDQEHIAELGRDGESLRGQGADCGASPGSSSFPRRADIRYLTDIAMRAGALVASGRDNADGWRFMITAFDALAELGGGADSDAARRAQCVEFADLYATRARIATQILDAVFAALVDRAATEGEVS
jgi:hypothetical protein